METYTGLVQLLNEVAGWLKIHTFMAIAILALVSGAVVGLANIGKDANLIVGRAINAVGSATSVVASLAVFLPFVVRSAAGVSSDPVSAPSCLARGSSCGQAASEYLRQFVPYSDLLAVATLCFFVAAVIWYVAAMVAAFKQ